MEELNREQIESELLDAIDLAWESFYHLCVNLNLLYAYQFAIKYGEMVYPDISLSEAFHHLNNSIAENLSVLKSALARIDHANSTP